MTNKTDVMWDRVEKAILATGKVSHVVYSAYETDDEAEPLRDNLDDVAIKGKCVFARNRDEYWGGHESCNYRSQLLENPTWLQICLCANDMIHAVRDEHHVFLEGVSFLKDREDGIPIYEFDMGS